MVMIIMKEGENNKDDDNSSRAVVTFQYLREEMTKIWRNGTPSLTSPMLTFQIR